MNHPFDLDLAELEATQSNSTATESLENAFEDFGISTTMAVGEEGGSDLWDSFDNPGNDVLVGDASDNSLKGGSGNDSLKGNRGDDSLYGGSGNDSLKGGSGNDILNGAADSFGLLFSLGGTGAGEVDTLTGGTGADTFILGTTTLNFVTYADGGNAASSILDLTNFMPGDDLSTYYTENPYYDSEGTSDYALITDFNLAKDSIQLAGSATDYTLGAAPANLPEGTGIYLDASENKELIGIVQGTTISNFSNGFTFV